MDYLTLRYLSHSGVKGQKWGVRRYQNADGSLTPEGRIHYGLGNLDYNARYSGDKKSAKKAYKAERKQLIKNIKNVTSKEAILLGHDNPLLTSRYQAGLREVDSYLSSKYGQETINSIKRDTRLKGEAIALATIGTGLLITSVVGLNKINKDRKQRAANEANATPDIDDMLAKEAAESGMSDDEFNKVIRNLNATKKNTESKPRTKLDELEAKRADLDKRTDEIFKKTDDIIKRTEQEAQNAHEEAIRLYDSVGKNQKR